MLPYHFGTVAALRDYGVTFSKATASSGGVMAALALLGGADLHLGVRQCFDLRDEKATTPGSIRSFFAVYREYFRCFRNPKFQRSLRLQELRDRLYVRLGRWTSKGWEIFQVTDFASEQELEDAFMSAAYVPLGTSVVPPYFRGSVAYDAALIDVLSGQIGFAAAKASLWPPEPNKGEAGYGVKDRTKVLVVPTQGLGHSIDPSDLVVVNGKFRSLIDFWAQPAVMERGFVEGYQMMASLIDTSETGVPHAITTRLKNSTEQQQRSRHGPAAAATTTTTTTAATPIEDDAVSRASDQELKEQDLAGRAAQALLFEVMAEQSSWKASTAFVKPGHLFERDPLLALFMLVALAVFAASYLWQLELNKSAIAVAATGVNPGFQVE